MPLASLAASTIPSRIHAERMLAFDFEAIPTRSTFFDAGKEIQNDANQGRSLGWGSKILWTADSHEKGGGADKATNGTDDRRPKSHKRLLATMMML
eukprot:1216571-Rhodomonas_salina.1